MGQERAVDRPWLEQYDFAPVLVLHLEAAAGLPFWGRCAEMPVSASLSEAPLQVQKPSATLLAEQDIAPWASKHLVELVRPPALRYGALLRRL